MIRKRSRQRIGIAYWKRNAYDPEMRSMLPLALMLFASQPVFAQPEANTSRAVRANELISMGERYIHAGDRASAMGYLRDAMNIHPQDPRPYLLLGKIYTDREEWLEAEAVYERGSQRCPNDDGILDGYARMLEAKGDVHAALRVVRQRVLLAPGNVNVVEERARLARATGAWSEALAAYRRIDDLLQEPEASVQLAIAALELLTKETDPVRARYACDSESPLRRSLAHCPGTNREDGDARAQRSNNRR